MNPLHIASKNGQMDVVRYLAVKATNTNSENEDEVKFSKFFSVVFREIFQACGFHAEI